MSKYTSNGGEPLPEDFVAVRADLDPLGGLPEDADHILTRGAHPELKYELRNLRGLSARTHHRRHNTPLAE